MVSRLERNELLRALVMDAIANDYEEPPIIIDEGSIWASERGLSVVPREVFAVLAELVQTGLAKAYRLSPNQPVEELRGLASFEREPDCYFLLTPAGKRALPDYE